jgi:hypothetical protein
MRYRVGPARAARTFVEPWDGETRGETVFDDGSWSEDQPTGVLAPNGEMIWRCASRVGFDLGFDDGD